MTGAEFYYLMSKNHDWVLHKRGCEDFVKFNIRIFLGSLYTDGQAIGTAKRHINVFSLCHMCINKPEVSQQ